MEVDGRFSANAPQNLISTRWATGAWRLVLGHWGVRLGFINAGFIRRSRGPSRCRSTPSTSTAKSPTSSSTTRCPQKAAYAFHLGLAAILTVYFLGFSIAAGAHGQARRRLALRHPRGGLLLEHAPPRAEGFMRLDIEKKREAKSSWQRRARATKGGRAVLRIPRDTRRHYFESRRRRRGGPRTCRPARRPFRQCVEEAADQ